MKLPNLTKIVDAKPYTPKNLSPKWVRVQSISPHQACYIHKTTGVQVVASLDTMEDGTQWKHISCSTAFKETPTWKIFYSVKNDFIGKQKEAFQVFPKKRDLLDIANALHLWSEC